MRKLGGVFVGRRWGTKPND